MTSTAARDAEEGCVIDRKIEHEKRMCSTAAGNAGKHAGGGTSCGVARALNWQANTEKIRTPRVSSELPKQGGESSPAVAPSPGQRQSRQGQTVESAWCIGKRVSKNQGTSSVVLPAQQKESCKRKGFARAQGSNSETEAYSRVVQELREVCARIQRAGSLRDAGEHGVARAPSALLVGVCHSTVGGARPCCGENYLEGVKCQTEPKGEVMLRRGIAHGYLWIMAQ